MGTLRTWWLVVGLILILFVAVKKRIMLIYGLSAKHLVSEGNIIHPTKWRSEIILTSSFVRMHYKQFLLFNEGRFWNDFSPLCLNLGSFLNFVNMNFHAFDFINTFFQIHIHISYLVYLYPVCICKDLIYVMPCKVDLWMTFSYVGGNQVPFLSLSSSWWLVAGINQGFWHPVILTNNADHHGWLTVEESQQK